MGIERGIYAYETAAGKRFYFKYRTADGRSATKRGFTARAPPDAREPMIVAVSRGEVAPPSRETFGEFYTRWLRGRRPYLEPGTHNDYRLHRVKRMATPRQHPPHQARHGDDQELRASSRVASSQSATSSTVASNGSSDAAVGPRGRATARTRRPQRRCFVRGKRSPSPPMDARPRLRACRDRHLRRRDADRRVRGGQPRPHHAGPRTRRRPPPCRSPARSCSTWPAERPCCPRTAASTARSCAG